MMIIIKQTILTKYILDTIYEDNNNNTEETFFIYIPKNKYIKNIIYYKYFNLYIYIYFL